MTISEIARLAGVSRGTVDRVLHNRGKVKPEIQERIEAIIQQTEYSPNFAAMVLKQSGKGLRLGVLLPPLHNAFYGDVKYGIERAAEHYAPYGMQVEIVQLAELTPACQCAAMQGLLDRGIDGLILTAIDTPQVADFINKITQSLPVITYNTDFTDAKRLCFVGQEHICAGRTAGNLLCNCLHRPGKIVPLISYQNILAHTQRVNGLRSVLAEFSLQASLAPTLESHESDEEAYQVVSRLLRVDPDVACIFVAGGGQVGAADALADSGRAHEIIMICYDLLPRTITHLKAGVVDYTIGQQPFLQGYLPISILYEYLVLGKQPQAEHYYTSIDVRLRENADFNGISALAGIL